MSNNRKPSHYLYAITSRSKTDKVWTKIGAAWPTSDLKGFSFRFDLFPAPGTDIAMRVPKEDGSSR